MLASAVHALVDVLAGELGGLGGGVCALVFLGSPHFFPGLAAGGGVALFFMDVLKGVHDDPVPPGTDDLLDEQMVGDPEIVLFGDVRQQFFWLIL